LVASHVPYECGNTTLLANRKRFLQFGLLLLASVYLLAARHVATTATYLEFQAQQLDTQWYGISGSVGLVAQHTAPAECLVNNPVAPPASSSKRSSGELIASVRAKTIAIHAAFTEQVRASRSILLALRRAEILFPFHSFW